jgi:hypothetical protein
MFFSGWIWASLSAKAGASPTIQYFTKNQLFRPDMNGTRLGGGAVAFAVGYFVELVAR